MTERFIPKSEWGDGPWQNEPDEDQWIDKATGLQCLAWRSPITGAWAGYAGVSRTHPAYGLDYEFDLTFDPEKKPTDWNETLNPKHDIERRAISNVSERYYRRQVAAWTAAQGRYPIQTMVNAMTSHWGLTFAGTREPLEGWFFGFDCAHAGDVAPAMNALIRTLPGYQPRSYSYPEQYRTLTYVRQRCRQLARQLADIELCVGRIAVMETTNRTPEEISAAIAEIVTNIANQGTV